MAKYITVLDVNANFTYWKAVQTADTLEDIRANRYYNAGHSSSIDKNAGDSFVESKTVIEVQTQTRASAKVCKLAPQNIVAMQLLNSKLSKAQLKKFESTLK